MTENEATPFECYHTTNLHEEDGLVDGFIIMRTTNDQLRDLVWPNNGDIVHIDLSPEVVVEARIKRMGNVSVRTTGSEVRIQINVRLTDQRLIKEDVND